ncbi:hypothetical protein [Flavobacterium macrobrachii]|uniref:hypothetical protein n=1 Tax=Flavobacterium macrobrachii TaxID=591204 RepID=UPI003F6FD1DA
MNWSYLFKHWFGTLLIGPIIVDIIIYLNYSKIGGLVEVYPIALIFSLIFSAPTYIIYGIIYHFLYQKNVKGLYSKIILIVLAVSGVYITTIIIKGNMMDDIAISYSISSIITGLFFKLNFNNDHNKPFHKN